MAILRIARMGHPVLARKADPVPDPTAPEIRRLLQDMVDTMVDAPGIGLAAPQVHVPLRVVIFHVPRERDQGAGAAGVPEGLNVLINPVVEPISEERALDWEGCLSLPGMTGRVPRFTRIRYQAVDHEGRRIERTAEGFHARVVQHECDHLDGILYPMRMTDLSTFGFAEEMRRGGAEVGEVEAE
jgi:peptide deformylase